MHTALTFQLAGPPIAVGSSYFGRSTGPILLSGVQCNGSELQLTDCQKTALNALLIFCDHGHDVGVICHGEFGTLHTLTLQVHSTYIKKCVHAQNTMHAPKTNKQTKKPTNKKVYDCGCYTKLPMTDSDKCPPV